MKLVRCAIYTRKSSDEGLEQGFNSLDAQREACAAYIASQASEGWVLLPQVYDDGGISGGTLERPALQALLAEVAAGQVDIIVVYKVDRLTRSLLDFAKLVEALDKAGTSFVSITQAFNTTTSMGRLTLNMLLSFAQFEREVTAERIRDKLAASKAKGMWMGGVPPLGYRANERSLAIVESQAALIRAIYSRYTALGNVRTLAKELVQQGVTVPKRRTGTGKPLGGGQFTRGQLYAILKNPIYAGDIGHNGAIYPGLHAPIIPRETWDAVQAQLASNTQGARGKPRVSSSILMRKVVDETGEPLIAAHTTKDRGSRKARYRYYVSKRKHFGEGAPGGLDSRHALQGNIARSSEGQDERKAGEPTEDSTSNPGLRIPARELEDAIAVKLAGLLDDPIALAQKAHLALDPAELPALAAACARHAAQLRRSLTCQHADLVAQVRVLPARLEIDIAASELAGLLKLAIIDSAPATFTLASSVRLTRTGRAVRLVQDSGAHLRPDGPDKALIRLVARARGWWAIIARGEIDPTTLAAQQGISDSYLVKVLRLAFLSPEIVEAIMAGRLKAGIDSAELMRPGTIDPDWEKQAQSLLAV